MKFYKVKEKIWFSLLDADDIATAASLSLTIAGPHSCSSNFPLEDHFGFFRSFSKMGTGLGTKDYSLDLFLSNRSKKTDREIGNVTVEMC